MQVIIVGDDQPLRVQLARTVGAGRFDVLCAVPHAEQVPASPGSEPLLALVAHRSALTARSELGRLRDRFGARLTLIVVANQPDAATSQLVVDGLVDDIVAWSHGATYVLARLEAVARQNERRPSGTPFLSAVAQAPRVPEHLAADPFVIGLTKLLRGAAEAGSDGLPTTRDHVFVWDMSSGEVTWPLEPDPEAAGLPTTRAAWDQRVHGDDEPLRELALERHMVTHTPYATATRMRFERPGVAPTWRTMLERGAVTSPPGAPRSVLGLLTDIDADVKLEVDRHIELRRSLVAEVAGGLAEELNASLLAAFTILDEVIDDTPAGRTRSDLDEARASLQGAFEWTRRLLALGRRAPPQPEYVALQDVAYDLVDRLARQLGSHIQLVVEARESPGVVLADPHQIEMVLTTLCERAARAMPRGGRVTVTLSASNLRDEPGILPRRVAEGRWAKVRVADAGDPLPAALIEGHFDPLAPGIGSDLRMAIALATVRSIVTQHEGFIRGINPSDGGAAFEVFLPVVTRPPARLRRPESGITTPVGGGEIVLVCDDDELVLRMVERLLTTAGYQVLTAADGDRGLALAEQYRGKVRLAILDIVMPIMGGRVASERLRAIDPSIPCLFMSGYTMSIQDTEFVQDPSRRFIPKPFNAGQLLREVRTALEAAGAPRK